MEVIDDLKRDGLVIVRDPSRFAYGDDAVLLSDFVSARRGERIIDIGTGTGILAILVHAKTGADIVAVDIDPSCCSMTRRSVELNKLDGSISVLQADARELGPARLGQFDAAVCNPPYFNSGSPSANESRLRSAFEETLSLGEAVGCAARLIKNGGWLYMCYPARSIAPLCAELEKNSLALKRLCFVRSKADKPPYLLLAKAKKGGGAGAELSYITLRPACEEEP